jgi:hypothetical protein
MGSNPILAAGRRPFGVTDTSRLAGSAPQRHHTRTTRADRRRQAGSVTGPACWRRSPTYVDAAMGLLTIEAFVVTDDLVEAYGGVQMHKDEIPRIAEQIGRNGLPMLAQHDERLSAPS